MPEWPYVYLMVFLWRKLSSFFAFLFKFVWLLITFIFTSSVFVYVLAPFQQPPPTGEVLNSSVISLSWSSPDSPNSNRLTYQLYRDEAEIYTTEDHYPYSKYLWEDDIKDFVFVCVCTYLYIYVCAIFLNYFLFLSLSFAVILNTLFCFPLVSYCSALLIFFERNEYSSLKSGKLSLKMANNFLLFNLKNFSCSPKAFPANIHRLQNLKEAKSQRNN